MFNARGCAGILSTTASAAWVSGTEAYAQLTYQRQSRLRRCSWKPAHSTTPTKPEDISHRLISSPDHIGWIDDFMTTKDAEEVQHKTQDASHVVKKPALCAHRSTGVYLLRLQYPKQSIFTSVSTTTSTPLDDE